MASTPQSHQVRPQQSITCCRPVPPLRHTALRTILCRTPCRTIAAPDRPQRISRAAPQPSGGNPCKVTQQGYNLRTSFSCRLLQLQVSRGVPTSHAPTCTGTCSPAACAASSAVRCVREKGDAYTTAGRPDRSASASAFPSCCLQRRGRVGERHMVDVEVEERLTADALIHVELCDTASLTRLRSPALPLPVLASSATRLHAPV